MRLCLIICAVLLTGCGGDTTPRVIYAVPPIEASLLLPCDGWTGPVPETEGQLADAILAEKRGRACANGRLQAVGEVLASWS